MSFEFTDKSGIEGAFVNGAMGGLSGLAGRYTYDKFIGAPLLSVTKPVGKYADVAAALLFAGALNYVARDKSDKLGDALRIAGFVPLADTLGRAVGDATPMSAPAPKSSSGSSNPWGSLAPVAITYGAEQSY